MHKKAIAAVALWGVALFSASQASALCVNVPEANLRKGPGTNFDISWEVFKYMPLQKIAQQGDWYQVRDVDGDEHWVYRQLVTDRMRCAVVKVDKVNVRTGPGTNHAASPLSPVEQYYSFKVLKTQGDWVRVEDEVFNEGWVYKPLLWLQ